MNDLDLIAELIPEAALPGPAELAPARERLGAAIIAEQAGERTPSLPPGPARRLRLVRVTGGPPARPSRRLAAIVAAAAAAAAQSPRARCCRRARPG
jgi:hypothetical protein